MSVLVTFQVAGDPDRLEQFAGENAEKMRSIADIAVERGVISHRFYGGDGRIMVVDEWPSAEAFKSFFEEMSGEIRPMMEAAGITSEPEITFWRKLETHDDIG